MASQICLTDKMQKNAYCTPAYANGVCYFRGDGDLLYWLSLAEDTKAEAQQSVKCLSTPYWALDGFLYFQGDGNKLIKMGAQWPYLHANLGELTCNGPPVASDGYVYFLVDGAKVMRAGTRDPLDTSTCATGVGASPPVIPTMSKTSMYYSETNGTIREIGIERGKKPGEGNEFTDQKTTQPMLACVDGYLYFLVDKTLHRYGLGNVTLHDSITLTHTVKGGVKAFQFGFDKRVYYLADDGYLYGLTVDPWPKVAPTATALCTVKMASAPCPGPAGFLLCQGADNKLYKIPTT